MRFILPILFAFFVAQIHAQQTLISSLVQPLTWEDTLRTNAEKFLKNSTPVFGYRFVIFGDFDGDQKPDTLVERFTDSTSTQEAPKYYYNSDTIYDYGDLVLLNMYLNPHSFIEWKKNDLILDGGQMGFHYIENCGDINRDGKDEIVLCKRRYQPIHFVSGGRNYYGRK